MTRRVAVVGAGWAGLACAVTLVDAGCRVSVFEAGRVPGGRARSVDGGGRDDGLGVRDNGQHVLIGPYRSTFALMDRLGVDRRRVLRRLPLALHGSDGLRLRVPAWPGGLGGLAALVGARGLGPGGRRALLRVARSLPQALSSRLPDLTVADWLHQLRQPPQLVQRLWAPLCVAALNTPAHRASARVFARVLRDGVFGAGREACIEVPARPLGELLPEPASAWLRARGAPVHLGCRVSALTPGVGNATVAAGAKWQVETLHGPAGDFDDVVVAVAPHQAGALLGDHAGADVRRCLDGLGHEAIATVHLRWAASPTPTERPGGRLADAKVPALCLLHDGPGEWLVDHGDGCASIVISAWTGHVGDADRPGEPGDAPRAGLLSAVAEQLRRVLPQAPGIATARVLIEKRATFCCTPDLVRPEHATGAAGLWLAGDYTAGPYPATLEGAVRSGVECAGLIAGHSAAAPAA